MFAKISCSESSSAVLASLARRRLLGRLPGPGPVAAKFRSGLPARVSALLILAKFLAVILATIPVPSRPTFAAEPGVAQEERLKDPDVIAELIKQLGDDKAIKREEATRDLMKAGREAFNPLREATKKGEKEPVVRARRALDEIELPVIRQVEQKLKSLGGQIHTSREGRITSICFRRVKIADADLACLSDLKDVVALEVSNTEVTDAIFDSIVDMCDLEYLCLEATRVTNTGVMRLKTLNRLKEIDLRETSISGVGLKPLTHIKSISTLNLYETKIDDDDIGVVADFTNTEYLNLSKCNISDKYITRLSTLPKLGRLELNDTRITDKALSEFKKFPELNDLWLNSTRITDKGVEDLLAVKQLGRVDVGNTRLSKDGIRRLVQMPTMRGLLADGMGVSENDAIEMMRENSEFNQLCIKDSRVPSLLDRNGDDRTCWVSNPVFREAHKLKK